MPLADGHPIFHGVDGQSGLHYDVPLGYGRVLEYSEVFNSNNLRYLSLDYAVGSGQIETSWGSTAHIWIRDHEDGIPIHGSEHTI